MTNNPQPPRPSLLREIIELMKEYPQAVKWLKIFGGGYIVFQVLAILFGGAILYTIYSAFTNNTAKFDERSAAFKKDFNERWQESEENWKDFDKHFDESIEAMKKWDEMNKKSYESLKKSDPRKDIYSPDETDLNGLDNSRNNQNG